MTPTPPPVASPAFESADIKTVRLALQHAFSVVNKDQNFVDDKRYDAALLSLDRLSARQAAFEAMRLRSKIMEIISETENNTVAPSMFYPSSEGQWRGAAYKILALAEAELQGKK